MKAPRMKRNRYPVAIHLLFRRGNAMLLSRRWQTGWRDGEYSVPAGHVEQGETVTQAAVREAWEEVGLRLDPAALEVVHVMHRAGDDGAGHQRPEDERIDFFLRVRTWAGEPVNAEPEKCDDLRWCELDELPENVVPYVRHAAGVRAGRGGVQRVWVVKGFGPRRVWTGALDRERFGREGAKLAKDTKREGREVSGGWSFRRAGTK